MPFNERSYLGGYSNRFPKGVKYLLIANIAVYVLYFLAEHSGYHGLFAPFYLVPAQTIGRLMIWQPVTYLFIHDPNGFGHILFNMLTLWMFGNELEGAWGTRRFLEYYFLCGIGAALCVIVANFLFGNPYTPTIGASGAIFGVILGYAMMWPDRELLFSFLFPIKAKYFAMILAGIELLITYATSFGGGVSTVAHLGGMAAGYVYLKSQRTVRRGYAGYGGGYAGGPRSHTTFWGNVREQYREWKLQRARRKFQVYLKKRQDQDPYVH